MTGKRHIVKVIGQWFTARNGDHEFDKVKASDRFGYRMLNLQSGVHFQKEKLSGRAIDNELNGSRRVVTNGCTESNGSLVKTIARGIGKVGCRCLLKQFLIAALHRALSGAEVLNTTVTVTDELHLHVPRLLHVPFDDDTAVAECPFGFGSRFVESGRELVRRFNDSDSTSSTTSGGFNEHGVTDVVGSTTKVVLGL
jgi:hypothetical protein